MTVITEFGHGTFKLGGNEFICQVIAWNSQPSNTRRVVTTACGTSTRFVNETFDVTVQFLQDWSAGGISKYMWDNYDTDVSFEFSPDPDLTPKLAGTVTCPRPAMGGGALDVLTDTQTFCGVGIPTLTADV